MCCGQINVKDSPYNAYGDGSHDDHDAIQDAIDAAAIAYGGGVYIRSEVCLPAGAYRCDSGLTVPYGVSLTGHPGGTVLDFSNASSSVVAIRWGTSAQDVSAGTISGLTMYGPNDGIGIMAGDDSSSGSNTLAGAAMRDCFVRNFGTGIKLGTNCFNNTFEQLRIDGNAVGLGLSSGPVNFGMGLLFEHCSFGSNDMHFNVNATAGGIEITFSACSFDSGTSCPEAQIGAGVSVFFDKCHWETAQRGSSGNALLLEIVYPCAATVFRDTRFVLPLSGGNANWLGTPVYWNSGQGNSMTVTFACCEVEGVVGGGTPKFYGRNSSYSSTQPKALVIQSPSVTADTGKYRNIPPYP